LEIRTSGERGRLRLQLQLSAKGLSYEAKAESCKSNGKENGGVFPSWACHRTLDAYGDGLLYFRG